MSNPDNRVVVTGIGIVSPLGLDTATTWDNLIAGETGIDYITSFDAESLDTKFGGEIKGFNATDHMHPKDTRHTDRFAQIAVAASLEAIKQSGLQVDQDNQDYIGVIIGSAIGGLDTLLAQAEVLLDRGPSRVSPFLVPMMITDAAAAQVSISLGLKGPNLCTTSACSSGSDAIGAAYELLKHGGVRVMLAGGSESAMNLLAFAAFNALRALSTRNSEPKLASRPFDAERDGFVLSEGSAILVLEELNHARERGVEILAEILSYGASADAFHITQPTADGEGAARAMKTALDRANISTDSIDYINAHGTSTQLNDKMETEAIKTVFGDKAYSIPISSTKSMTGHMIAGAGAVEASICMLAIRNGIIPPTINLVNPDPDCDLDYVPNVARHTEVNTALSNSFGFGGHNSTLIIGRYGEA
ncbi:beta-ketoacyl-ACP synthase II [Chloroflexota bacterium]